MFEFKTKEACNNFKASDVLNHLIDKKRDGDKNFIPMVRLVWVDIEGFPLRAWSKDTFRRIIKKWGEIAHLYEDLGKTCIRIWCVS